MSACLPCDLEQQSPTFLVPGISFWEDNFSTHWGWVGVGGDGLGMIQVHYMYTFFLLLLWQFHSRSSVIRSQRLGTHDLEQLHP